MWLRRTAKVELLPLLFTAALVKVYIPSPLQLTDQRRALRCLRWKPLCL